MNDFTVAARNRSVNLSAHLLTYFVLGSLCPLLKEMGSRLTHGGCLTSVVEVYTIHWLYLQQCTNTYCNRQNSYGFQISIHRSTRNMFQFAPFTSLFWCPSDHVVLHVTELQLIKYWAACVYWLSVPAVWIFLTFLFIVFGCVLNKFLTNWTPTSSDCTAWV